MKGKETGKEKILILVGDLEKEEKTPHAVHVAVCRIMGWNPGKSVERKAYQEAVGKFMKSPMEGAGSC